MCIDWAQLGSFPAQHGIPWDNGQLGWNIHDGIPHGKWLVLAIAQGTTGLCMEHLGSSLCDWSFSQHLSQLPRGKKQKLPVLLRPGFVSPRISFLWLKQSSPSNPFSQFSSVTQSCLTLFDPMDCSTPGHPVQLPEFTQTHVH